MAQLQRAADQTLGRGRRPSGTSRLTTPRAPFDLVIAPALAGYQQSYPEVRLEIAVEARMIDIVKERYDAGFRYGPAIDKDMVAVLVAPRSEAMLVAAPSYLRGQARPQKPDDLREHRLIACRSQGTGQLIAWALVSGDDTARIVPTAATIVHDLASQIDLATRGLGIVSAPAAMVGAHLADGRLTRMLPAWHCPMDEVYLYFPSRRHRSAALRAFIAAMQWSGQPQGA